MENSRGKRNIGEWSLWTGLAVLGGLSVYYYPLFALTLFIVPAVWAVMAFRTHPAMLAAVGGIVFLFGLLMGYGTTTALSVLGTVAPAGCCLWFCQKERMGNFRSVIFTAVLLTFGQFLLFCLPDLVASGDPYASLRSYFSLVPEIFQGTALYETSRLVISRLDELMIACFFVFAGVYALVNVLMLHVFNSVKKEMPLCPLGKYGTWSASYWYVMILGALSLVAALMTMTADTPTVSALSMLLYEMWSLPLMLTGANFLFAILKRWLPKNRVGLVYGLSLGLGLLFLSQFASMVLLLLGLIGVLRKRRAGKEQP